ncbi:MAG: hypothetical protein ACP5HG_00050 [Anaerolineae bacterium]
MVASSHDEQAEHLPVVSRDSRQDVELVAVSEASHEELARARRAEIVKQALAFLSSIGQLALRILSEREASTSMAPSAQQRVSEVDIETPLRQAVTPENLQRRAGRRQRRRRGNR